MSQGSVGGGEKTIAEVLIERSPNSIMTTTADGRIAAVNPAVHELLPIVPGAVRTTADQAVPIERLADALDPAVSEEVEFHLESGHRTLLVKVIWMGTTGHPAGRDPVRAGGVSST